MTSPKPRRIGGAFCVRECGKQNGAPGRETLIRNACVTGYGVFPNKSLLYASTRGHSVDGNGRPGGRPEPCRGRVYRSELNGALLCSLASGALSWRPKLHFRLFTTLHAAHRWRPIRISRRRVFLDIQIMQVTNYLKDHSTTLRPFGIDALNK
jgi:hypothetical protein